MKVADLRHIIFKALKSEPYTGKSRYTEQNKPSWWTPKVDFVKPPNLTKPDLIEVVKHLQKLKVTTSPPVTEVAGETPGMRSCYSMDSPVRGICLAILNGTFAGKKDFETKIDKQVIYKTFKELHFECHIHENLRAGEMIKVIKDTAALDHSKYDALVLFASSHGSKDTVQGTDLKSVTQQQIVECFCSINCQTLANKPKLFVFDVCRGKKPWMD